MPNKIDPDATHGHKLLGLFLKLMLEGKKHYQSDLAKEFECSPQTIIRLTGTIEGLIGNQLDIGKDKGRRYYRIKTFNSRQSFGLDFEELRYLNICRDLASGVLPGEVTERIDSTIHNLSCMLADQDYARRGSVQRKHVWFNPKGYIDYTPHQKTIGTLLECIEERTVCLVQYRSSTRKEPRTHRYAAERMVYMNGAFYVLGHSVSRGSCEELKPTNLAIHRILEVNPTDEHHDCRSDDDDLGYFGLKRHEPKTFRIKFSANVADYIRERVWSSEQKIYEEEDGGIVLEVATVSEPELMAWVRSFGEDAVDIHIS